MNVSIIREVNGIKTRMPVVPINNADSANEGVVVYDPTSQTFRIGNDVITLNDLIITGDLEVENDSMFRSDVSISGDLYVSGTEHISDSETTQSSGDYMILRHNNQTPLGLNEQAGLAIFNYALNKTATLTVDKNGEWRLADNTATSTIHNNLYYFDGHYYNTSFVEQTFVDQIKTAFDVDEVADCVFYNSNSFYHYDGTHWFAVELVSNHLVTDTTEVTDTALIAALDALTKGDLQYFRRLQITVITPTENEPLFTRDERSNMTSDALVRWDAATSKAKTIAAPTTDTYLKASPTAGHDEVVLIRTEQNHYYEVASDGTISTTPYTGSTADVEEYGHTLPLPSPYNAAYLTSDNMWVVANSSNSSWSEIYGINTSGYYLIYDDPPEHFDFDSSIVLEEMNPIMYHIPAQESSTTYTWTNAPVEKGNNLTNNALTKWDNGVINSIATPAQGTYLKYSQGQYEWSTKPVERADITSFNRIAIYDDEGKISTMSAPTINGQVLTATVNGQTITYTWSSSSGGGGTFYFATMADFDLAKVIPEGQTGYVPNNSTIVIGEIDNNLIGEDA